MDNKLNTAKNTGFTLIELLVVVAIIGVLSSVVLASLSTARAKSRDSKRVAEVKQLRLALELYYDSNGTYPISNWIHSTSNGWQDGSHVLATSLKPYLKNLPIDPINTFENVLGGYHYSYYSNSFGGPGEWYMIVFTLENQNIPLDLQDGVTTPNGRRFDYFGNDGYIITLGASN